MHDPVFRFEDNAAHFDYREPLPRSASGCSDKGMPRAVRGQGKKARSLSGKDAARTIRDIADDAMERIQALSKR